MQPPFGGLDGELVLGRGGAAPRAGAVVETSPVSSVSSASPAAPVPCVDPTPRRRRVSFGFGGGGV
jgi:hypothetical protein